MIDKLLPMKFVADKDERLVESNEMIAAKNVTVSHRGEGTEMILKTMAGTSSIPIATDVQGMPAFDNSVTVVGKVEEEQTGKIYFFCEGSGVDGIYQYDSSTNKFQPVFLSPWFNLSSASKVQASCIRKAFQQNGVLQTIVYFTDNQNPPRKINIERALAGDYNGMTNAELDIALSVIRKASTTPPVFEFTTDSNFKDNNFVNRQIQYATQIIYKDGEESALSPYSKMANSLATLFEGVEGGSYGSSRFTGNVCEIRHMIDLDTPDMSKIRILAREGNSGQFFTVDEFDPNKELYRSIGGAFASTEIYDPNTGVYKFYNNRFGPSIETSFIEKNFDNVPLKAEGQCIIQNRLMYSNYTEGYANYDSFENQSYTYNITPRYSVSSSGSEDYIVDGTDEALIFDLTDANNLDVDLDLADGTNIASDEVFSMGTVVDISFEFTPEFTATAHNSENLISVKHAVRLNSNNLIAPAPEQGQQNGGNIYAQKTSFVFDDIVSGQESKVMRFTYVIPEELTVNEVAQFVQARLENESYTLSYDIDGQTLTSPYADGTGAFDVDCTAVITWKFGEVDYDEDADKIQITPRIEKIRFKDVEVSNWTDDVNTYVSIDDQDVHVQPGDAQSEVSFSGLTSHAASNADIRIEDNGAGPSFKAGATHAFGIVYYGFVRELGEVYAKSLPERTAAGENKGPVSMEFDLDDVNFYAPGFADSYQIVYGGSSIANTFQYTVGGAYAHRKTTTGGDSTFEIVDDDNHVIYVSLKTFDKYQEEREPVKRYSFTKGDKLRILSHRDSSNGDALVYPLNDGKPLEFDVLGVVTLDGGSPIQVRDAGANDDRDPYVGTFVKLSCPTVESTVNLGADVVKFEGFDWYQITGEDYNGDVSVDSVSNLWNREVLVEIFTPKKDVSDRIYYEIGERQPITTVNSKGGQHKPNIITSSGDVYFRPSMMKHPKYNSGWKDLDQSGIVGTSYANEEDPGEWVYSVKYSEDHKVNDHTSDSSWDRGRPHSVFQNAAKVTRSNSISYSRAYVDDSAVLPLSQFNLNEANFYDLPSEYGACRFIGQQTDKLIAIQENKCSLLGIGKSVLESADGSGIVAVNTNVINAMLPYAGDFGTQNPESVVRIDGGYYVVDKKRKAIFFLKGGSLGLISAIEIDSFIESKIDSWESGGGLRIVSGFDPDDSVVFFTFQGGSSECTVGFNQGFKFWQGEYTFIPDCYATVNNKMFGFKHNVISSSRYVIHKFGHELASNVFLGESVQPSSFEVVSKANPSMVKGYKSLSLEGDSAWTVNLESSEGQTSADLSFDEKEDAFYAHIGRDTSVRNDTKYLPIGTVDTNSNAGNGIRSIKLKNSIQGYLIPVGYNIYQRSGGSFVLVPGSNVLSVNHGTDTITTSGQANSLAAGDKLFAANTSGVTGDLIRGHYLIVKCSTTPVSGAQRELYAININFFESKANHRLGR